MNQQELFRLRPGVCVIQCLILGGAAGAGVLSYAACPSSVPGHFPWAFSLPDNCELPDGTFSRFLLYLSSQNYFRFFCNLKPRQGST